jgi:hypothetical protein
MRALAVTLLIVSSLACASPRARIARSGGERCEGAAAHVDALLREGLETYVTQMKRYAAARDPEATTAGSEARVWNHADAWSKAHRPELANACRRWDDAQYRCVMDARAPAALNGCGLASVVDDFTDEVVADFSARPLDSPSASR